jgi:hypothetical protein
MYSVLPSPRRTASSVWPALRYDRHGHETACADINHARTSRGEGRTLNEHLTFLHNRWTTSANVMTQQELRAELSLKGLHEAASYGRAGCDIGRL